MADRYGMVQMKALTLFTRNSPTTAAILHGDDREKADVAARFPLVSEEDAEFLEAEKLAKPYDGKVPVADDAGLEVGERAGIHTENEIEAENSVDATTGLATRQSTAFEKDPHRMAGEGGVGRAFVLAGRGSAGAGGGEQEAPAGSGKGVGKPAGGGEESGPKPYSQMKTADLQAEADKEPKVDLSGAKNNEERARLLEAARGNKAPAEHQ